MGNLIRADFESGTWQSPNQPKTFVDILNEADSATLLELGLKYAAEYKKLQTAKRDGVQIDPVEMDDVSGKYEALQGYLDVPTVTLIKQYLQA